MVTTIFTTPLAQTVLVFVLVFVTVFAVLQKSKVFGDGKKQIDAFVALAVGLIVTSVSYAIDFISKLVPFMAVVLVVILVLLILLGSLHQEGKFELPKSVMWTFGVAAVIAVVGAVLKITNAWDYIYYVAVSDESGVVSNVIFIVIIIAAIVGVMTGSNSGGGKDKK